MPQIATKVSWITPPAGGVWRTSRSNRAAIKHGDRQLVGAAAIRS